nr:family 1 glycosylhydrolase [Streptomyces sp. MBT53]
MPGAEAATAAYGNPREDVFIEAARDDDWIGVRSSTRTRIGVDGPIPTPDDAERTLTGWEHYPEAIHHARRHTAAIIGDVPLIVTENGIATADDSRCVDYGAGALSSIAAALEDGLDIRGHLAWSALDTYEWGLLPTHLRPDRRRPRHSRTHRTPKLPAARLGNLGRTRMLPRAHH